MTATTVYDGSPSFPLNVTNADGSGHTMPAGDAATRPVFTELSDGVNPVGTSGNPLRVDPTGTTTQPVKTAVSGGATLTNVNSSATSVQILASNASRRGACFYNDSSQVLYLKFGASASSSSYTVQLGAAGTSTAYYELPQPCYTGEIDGIWAAANGAVRVTELT